MALLPVGNIQPFIEASKPVASKPESPSVSFTDVFKQAAEEVASTEAEAKKGQMLLATGQTDDLHTIMIDAAKAELALNMFVQIRNKALEAYNDLMKMTL